MDIQVPRLFFIRREIFDKEFGNQFEEHFDFNGTDGDAGRRVQYKLAFNRKERADSRSLKAIDFKSGMLKQMQNRACNQLALRFRPDFDFTDYLIKTDFDQFQLKGEAMLSDCLE